MPSNVGHEYERVEKEYLEADSLSEKLKYLQKMLSVLPKHKGNEKLQREIKQRISKYKALLEKEKKASKKGRKGLSIKKEGAAQVVIIGKTNSGKSYLLSKITNAKPLIADYEFTTKKPEVGTMDYNGIAIQMIEIPAITKNFIEKEKGPAFMGIVRGANLILILARNNEEEKFLKNELQIAAVTNRTITIRDKEDIEKIKEKIWDNLNLIYVFTKSPGKEKDHPPVALKKGANVENLALNVHKDFVKKFDFAKVWGKSAKHDGMRCGLKHVLDSGDIVELHLK